MIFPYSENCSFLLSCSGVTKINNVLIQNVEIGGSYHNEECHVWRCPLQSALCPLFVFKMWSNYLKCAEMCNCCHQMQQYEDFNCYSWRISPLKKKERKKVKYPIKGSVWMYSLYKLWTSKCIKYFKTESYVDH